MLWNARIDVDRLGRVGNSVCFLLLVSISDAPFISQWERKSGSAPREEDRKQSHVLKWPARDGRFPLVDSLATQRRFRWSALAHRVK